MASAFSGSIGGTGSHEFHVLADSGEDAIAYCPASDYAANVELAEAVAPAAPRPAAKDTLKKVHTPGVKTIADLCAFLKIPAERTVKAVVVDGADGEPVLLKRRSGRFHDGDGLGRNCSGHANPPKRCI